MEAQLRKLTREIIEDSLYHFIFEANHLVYFKKHVETVLPFMRNRQDIVRREAEKLYNNYIDILSFFDFDKPLVEEESDNERKRIDKIIKEKTNGLLTRTNILSKNSLSKAIDFVIKRVQNPNFARFYDENMYKLEIITDILYIQEDFVDFVFNRYIETYEDLELPDRDNISKYANDLMDYRTEIEEISKKPFRFLIKPVYEYLEYYLKDVEEGYEDFNFATAQVLGDMELMNKIAGRYKNIIRNEASLFLNSLPNGWLGNDTYIQNGSPEMNTLNYRYNRELNWLKQAFDIRDNYNRKISSN